MKKALIVDVSSIIYRAFYTNLYFKTSDGIPTGAIYGFTNILFSLKNKFNPDYIFAAFDVKRSELERSKEFKDYKSNRKPMPIDLLNQIPYIEEILDACNIQRFKVSGYEADDVIGTLSEKLYPFEDIKTYIVTSDKDMSQLVNYKTHIIIPGKTSKGEYKIIQDDNDVINHLGVKANRIPDLFGLIGDKIDGIPGIPGIGPKTAIPLIIEYGSLENIISNVDKIKSESLKKKIIDGQKNGLISKKLATIKKDLDIDFELKPYQIDKSKLNSILTKLEFKSFIKRLDI